MNSNRSIIDREFFSEGKKVGEIEPFFESVYKVDFADEATYSDVRWINAYCEGVLKGTGLLTIVAADDEKTIAMLKDEGFHLENLGETILKEPIGCVCYAKYYAPKLVLKRKGE